jgi:hypothetical protein
MELEVRIDRLEEALTRLAQAQERTEARVGELAQALARTDMRIGELAQALARTEGAVLTLAQQVGRLSETFGFTLEELGREVAPAYLAQHHRLHVPQLDRRFFTVDGDEVEVDLYGEGEQDGKAVVVIGEVRSRIYGRDVESATQRAARLRPQLPGVAVVVLFGFVIHPSARVAARRLDAIVISSSGRPDRW